VSKDPDGPVTTIVWKYAGIDTAMRKERGSWVGHKKFLSINAKSFSELMVTRGSRFHPPASFSRTETYTKKIHEKKSLERGCSPAECLWRLMFMCQETLPVSTGGFGCFTRV